MEYSTPHSRLLRTKGPAAHYTCVRCGGRAKEWALNHESPRVQMGAKGSPFSPDIEDYSPMCFGCHRRYDKEHITACPKNHPYDDENTIYDAGKRKCKTCVYERNTERRRRLGLTPEQHARRIELQRQRRAQEKARMAADENYSAERFICGAPCRFGGLYQASPRGSRSDLGWMWHCNTHVKTAGARCWRHKEQPA